MVITFCVMQVWNLNGELIESRPLKPTVPVKWTLDDLLQARDPDLAAALRHFERQTGSVPPGKTTGANTGRPSPLPMRARWAARVRRSALYESR
jgi:hypothetical protein